MNKLVEETGAAPILLGHLLRALASFGFIEETGQDEFVGNRVTKALANPHAAGAFPHMTGVHAPVAAVLPLWLKKRNYQNITDNMDLPFHEALGTTLAPFEWMKQQPEQMKALGHAMAINRDGNWVNSYPVEKEVGSFVPSSESALLVDVGGGFGQQAVAFKNKFTKLSGRIVVQDIPSTLQSAPKVEGIEFVEQDFFKPQSVKGAKFYYLRHILHDWSDEHSISILENLIPALGPDSKIVIDETVLPNTNVPWQAAYMDLTMMGSLGGIERTRAEFENVLDRAGLKIVDVHRYDEKLASVILAVPK